MLVVDEPGCDEALSQSQLSFQDQQRPRTQLHAAIIAGLRLTAIHPGDARFADADNAVLHINIRQDERDLLRGAKSAEKPKLVVVALCFAPVAMKGGNHDFGIVHAKRIDLGTIHFAQAGAAQATGGVGFERAVLVAEVKGASKHAE